MEIRRRRRWEGSYWLCPDRNGDKAHTGCCRTHRIRTTVYSNQKGYYEFPVLEAGSYTLRIARPLEFHPYLRESVGIEADTTLETIVLERVSQSEFLPPTPEILSQLTGSRRAGHAVAIGEPFPVTLERLLVWLPTLEEKGFVAAPISAVVNKQTVR